ncbi:hypothetical protein MCAP1_003222 [Malassezia caprae]|uniref:Protein ROT1 n=1 Tax=Malassezia caprae TaxID=1381934 RepID=A0AAF0E743_9BASI|nr:hypothetical protein MCAP1_003222 [Malassezia caprae]
MPPMALLRVKAAHAHWQRAAARSTYECYSPSRALSRSSVRATVRRGDPLPEDPTPAMWQRIAQLVAGTTATGTLAYFVFLADFGEAEHCFSPMLVRTLVALLVCVLAQLVSADSTDPKSLVGTWSSGSGGVLTGQYDDGSSFYNPMKRQFSVPPTAGYSYSFSEDGKFETAQFFYQSNPTDPHCFNATLLWQHGTYKVSGNTLTMNPYKGDGSVQSMGECLHPQVRLDYYSHRVEKISNWSTFIETDPVFFPKAKSVYGLQMYKFNGEPLPKMYLRFRPPQMMPTQPIFKQVIGAPDA